MDLPTLALKYLTIEADVDIVDAYGDTGGIIWNAFGQRADTRHAIARPIMTHIPVNRLFVWNFHDHAQERCTQSCTGSASE